MLLHTPKSKKRNSNRTKCYINNQLNSNRWTKSTASSNHRFNPNSSNNKTMGYQIRCQTNSFTSSTFQACHRVSSLNSWSRRMSSKWEQRSLINRISRNWSIRTTNRTSRSQRDKDQPGRITLVSNNSSSSSRFKAYKRQRMHRRSNLWPKLNNRLRSILNNHRCNSSSNSSNSISPKMTNNLRRCHSSTRPSTA